MAHTRVLHIERGFHMSKTYAEQVMRDHCSITWVIPNKTIRDTTNEERIALRAKQAERVKRLEPLAASEIHGLKFIPPASGKLATDWETRWISEARDFVKSATECAA